MAETTAHIIAHTHWDREWYMPFERHHVRLVELIDQLITVLEQDPHFHSFHLDGQTIILEDYLAVRPEMRERLVTLVQAGRLQIGPWYILQDAFLTSSEANIRNLLIGHHDARAFGPVCKLGYFPDTFGNMGQAPQLLRQAGMDTAVFGRGVRPVGFNNTTLGAYESPFSEMRWQAPDGSTVLGILFANWYHNGMEIPVEPQAARRYWPERIAAAKRFAATPHLLFMNGCDHQPVQTDLSAALTTAREQFPDVTFVHTDFPSYIAHVKDALPEQLATVHGELRSQRTDGWWTLVNTASARVYLKQANYRSQTQLEKVAEPLAACAALLGHSYPRHLFTYAWKTLMQNHPHDSICGCSVDEVHQEMLTRFAKSEQVATAIAQSSLDAIVAHIDTLSPWEDDPHALPFVVFNTSGWERSGAASIEVDVKRLPLDEKRAETIAQLQALPLDGYAVIDSLGRPVAVTVEDMGVRFGYELPHDRFRQPYMARTVRVTFSANAVPALGYRSYALVGRGPELVSAVPTSESVSPRMLENEFLSVQIAENGTLCLTDKRSGRVYDGLCAYEDVGDIGNEYVFRQPDGDQAYSTTSLVAHVTLQEQSAVRTVYEIVHEWMIPASADPTLEREQREFVPLLERSAKRSPNLISQRISTRVTLEQGVPYLAVQTTLDNQAKDHRLRVLFPTDCSSQTYQVDSIFEVATRDIVPAPEWRNPSNCQHQQAFVHVGDTTGGLTIANHGLPEYEVLCDDRSTIALTLLRAVGELGDWGVFPTPEALCLGQHSFSYAIIPHAAGQPPVDSYQQAYQFQVPWTVRQVPLHSGELPAEHSFIRWSGQGMALTAVKIAEESDDLILRWFNTSTQPTTLTVDAATGVGDWYHSTILEDDTGSVEIPVAVSVRGAEIVTLGGRRSQAG